LQEEIEQIRLNLVDIIDKKGILSTDAIRETRILNDKIKEYYRINYLLSNSIRKW
jgi:hypothetical protein